MPEGGADRGFGQRLPGKLATNLSGEPVADLADGYLPAAGSLWVNGRESLLEKRRDSPGLLGRLFGLLSRLLCSPPLVLGIQDREPLRPQARRPGLRKSPALRPRRCGGTEGTSACGRPCDDLGRPAEVGADAATMQAYNDLVASIPEPDSLAAVGWGAVWLLGGRRRHAA
jgi:hypothetical protein